MRREPIRLNSRFSSLAARFCLLLGGARDVSRDRGGGEIVELAFAGARRVHVSGAAADGREGLLPHGVVHHSRERAHGVLAGDAHAPQRDAGEVVDGAVERVDDPAQAGGPLAVGGALLAEDPVVGPAPGEHRGDRGLRGPVGVRDEVGWALLGAEAPRRAPVPCDQLGARAERRLPGDLEHVAGHDGRALDVPLCLHASDFTTPCRPFCRTFTGS
jgi:hypothetical protein